MAISGQSRLNVAKSKSKEVGPSQGNLKGKSSTFTASCSPEGLFLSRATNQSSPVIRNMNGKAFLFASSENTKHASFKHYILLLNMIHILFVHVAKYRESFNHFHNVLSIYHHWIWAIAEFKGSANIIFVFFFWISKFKMCWQRFYLLSESS